MPQILRAAGDLVVEAQQHQLGERRAARVQVAQIVIDGAQLLARQVERAARGSQIAAVADGGMHGAEALSCAGLAP